MKKQNASVFIIIGAVISALCLGLIVYGIWDFIETSKYRNVVVNPPFYFILALGLIAGVVLMVRGIKKRTPKN